MKRLLQTYWLSLLIAVVIGYLSLSTGKGLPHLPLFPHADKLIHFAMYLGLSSALTFNLRKGGHQLVFTGVCAVLIATIYGGALELIQPFFPPRTCDLLDFIANVTGVAAGYTLTDTLWIRTHSYTK